MMRNLLILLIAVATSCFAVQAQPSNVKFDKTVHDFGDIMLNSGKHSFTFTFQNTGSTPVVIQQVVSSCGCTTADYTRSPVIPGASGKIEATFLNDQGPYPFDKSITVYISGENPIILRIKGVVHERQKELRELYPVAFGNFAMRGDIVDMGDINQGETKDDVVPVANISTRTIQVSFSDVSRGVTISPNPITIPAGQKADISITLNTKEELKWGNSNYFANVTVDGRRITDKRIEIRARIRDNFSGMTQEDVDKGAVPMANSSSYDFGVIKRGESASHSFQLRNIGESELIIHKIEPNQPGTISRNPGRIAKGASDSIDITVTPDKAGDIVYAFSLYTNAPKRPIMILLVTGKVN